MNLNHTKSKGYNGNNNLSNGVDIGDGINISNGVNNEIPWIDGLPPTNPNQTKSESCSNYCDLCNIMGKEISFTEEIQPNHSNLNRFRSKCHSDNIVDSNHHVRNRLGDKEFWLENFEGSE